MGRAQRTGCSQEEIQIEVSETYNAFPSLTKPEIEDIANYWVENNPKVYYDGNNLKSIIDNANQLIKHIRNSRRPAFLETFTYRLYGHVDWREDIDVGVGRSTSDLNLWKSRDPIKRLINALSKYESFSERLQIIEGEVRSKIMRDWEKAESDSLPNNSELLTHVYFSNSKEQNV